MPAARTRTVSLPDDLAADVDRLVASGRYASAGEVVRAGLDALHERDAAVERWLRADVAAAHDAAVADPARVRDLAAVFARLRARHAAREPERG
jgi:antitoxin ParD1/3/4